MENNILRLGEYNYLVTLDNSDNLISNYGLIKPLLYGKMVNDMPIVTDVVFCPYNFDLQKITDIDVWPNISNNFIFNTSYKNMGYIYNKEIFKDTNKESISICKCKMDELKIWHPNNKKNQNYIVHCYSVINSIKYHWFVGKVDSSIIFNDDKNNTKISYGIGKEQKIGNSSYSEYVSISVPNIESLFAKDIWVMFPSNIWIDDDILNNYLKFSVSENVKDMYVPNKIIRKLTETEYNLLNPFEQIKCIQTSTDPIEYTYTTYDIKENSIQYVKLSLLMNKWSILDGRNNTKYMKFDISSNTFSNNMNVSIYPYKQIVNETYIMDKEMPASVCTFNSDNKINLKCNIGFVDSKISIIGNFTYKNSDSITFQDYYEKTYNVDLTKYKKYSNDVDEISVESSNDIDELLQGHKEMCGYIVMVASDIGFKNIIWTQSSYSNSVDDFAIPIIDLFTDWNQVPPNVYAKCIFIDRYIGLTISSNVKVLTKDDIKYTIIDTNETRSTNLVKLQEYDGFIPKQYKSNNDIAMGQYNSTFFIDNIRCNIIRNKEQQNNDYSRQSKPRVIYKPLFYRTEDSHVIKIRQNVTQNVGINLSKYMTKVDTFYMRIGNYDYMEVARNGIYIIFKVDAMKNQITTDKYDIIDTDGNYITTGSITLI